MLRVIMCYMSVAVHAGVSELQYTGILLVMTHSTQGFQCFVEDLTGFGHFSHDLLQLLGDDYPRSPIMLYALRMPQPSVSERP